MLLPVPAPAGPPDAVVDGEDDLLTLSPFEGSPVLSRQRPQECRSRRAANKEQPAFPPGFVKSE
jgi:hypothetical protein